MRRDIARGAALIAALGVAGAVSGESRRLVGGSPALDDEIFAGRRLFGMGGLTVATNGTVRDSHRGYRIAQVHGEMLAHYFGVGHAYPRRMSMIVVDSAEEFVAMRDKYSLHSQEALGYYFPREHWGVSYPYATTLIHECTHAFLHEHVRRLPRWFNEGTAAFSESHAPWIEAAGMRARVANVTSGHVLDNLEAGVILDSQASRLENMQPAMRHPSHWLLRKGLRPGDFRWWVMARATIAYLADRRCGERTDLQHLFDILRREGMSRRRQQEYLEGPVFDGFRAFVPGLIARWKAPARTRRG